MITTKTPEEIKILSEGGKILASILNEVAEKATVGISTQELNDLAKNLIQKTGGRPAFLNYAPPSSADRKYPASLCVSINEEIVHGLPSGRTLKEGDIVSLDLGLEYKKLFTDMALTIGIGHINPKHDRLINITKEALIKGESVLRDGATLGDYGFVIQQVAKSNGFGVVKDLVGHGVGYLPHEDPDVPNYGERRRGLELKVGMVFALEPMICEGKGDIVLSEDNWTWKTKDGLFSAHFEHTIVVESSSCRILTKV